MERPVRRRRRARAQPPLAWAIVHAAGAPEIVAAHAAHLLRASGAIARVLVATAPDADPASLATLLPAGAEVVALPGGLDRPEQADAWLAAQVTARWAILLRGGEIPSEVLLRALPALFTRNDLTHLRLDRVGTDVSPVRAWRADLPIAGFPCTPWSEPVAVGPVRVVEAALLPVDGDLPAPPARAAGAVTVRRPALHAVLAEVPLTDLPEPDRRGSVDLRLTDCHFVAGEPCRVRVLVRNGGGARWPGGGWPGVAIAVRHRWSGAAAAPPPARTPLPCALRPGEETLVLLDAVPPAAGMLRLELALVAGDSAPFAAVAHDVEVAP